MYVRSLHFLYKMQTVLLSKKVFTKQNGRVCILKHRKMFGMVHEDGHVEFVDII